jgi:PKD repeat protein
MQPYPSAAPGTAAGQQQVDFFLGTYLLLKGDHTYLNIDYGGGVQYYPEYQLDLGAPAAPPPGEVSGYLWNGVYRRDFQNGFVLVNPGSTSYTLNLGGSYRLVQGHGGGAMTDAQLDAGGHYTGGSLTYQDVSGVTLAGESAAIFLNPANSPLAVTSPARAAANPVPGTSVGLSVRGQENGSDSGLTYTWSGSGPAAVAFSDNGTNSARDTTATFVQAGTYTFTATISDGSQSVTSGVTVTVKQTLTSLQVSPASATVVNGATQQFSATALDQFGLPLATQPAFAWSIDAGGVGTIDNNGLYTAPTTGVGSATVRAGSGGTSASATVGVVASGTATFVTEDTTHQGNWQGVYGSQGDNVIGGPASYPSYAQVTPGGKTDYVWRSSTSDARALQVPGGGRVAATWYSRTSYTVDVNLTDGQTHGLALYFLDWDNGGLSERIDVLDAQSGAALGSWTVSSFTGGEYLVLNVSGHVTLRFTRLAGSDCDLSGLFFDPAWGGPTPHAVFSGPASASEGTATATVAFSNVSGGSGGYGYSYDFDNDGTFEVSGSNSASAAVPESYLDDGPSTREVHGRVADSAGNFADYTASITVTNVAPGPGITPPPSAVAGSAASFQASATDPSSADTSAGFSYSWDFGDGTPLVAGASPSHSYAAPGTYTVTLTATDKDGGQGTATASLTVSGAAGTGASAALVTLDAATQGNWQGVYGRDGYNVIGGPAGYPAYAQVTPGGKTDYVWRSSTTEARALQVPGGGRVAATWYSRTSYTVDVNLTDGQTHGLALYFLDWDNSGLSERVDVLDAQSGAALGSWTVSSFTGGKYLVLNVTGHVTLRFTRLAGADCDLSGLFFDPQWGG